MKTSITIIAMIAAFVAIGLSYFIVYKSWSHAYDAEYKRLEMNKQWIEESIYVKLEITKLNAKMEELQKSLTVKKK